MRPLIITLAVASFVILLAPEDAAACGNATLSQVDANVKKVKAADAALEKGEIAAAKKAANEVRIFLSGVELVVDEGKRKEDLRPLLRRAIRIESLATSRDPKSTDKERDEALATFEKNVFGPQ